MLIYTSSSNTPSPFDVTGGYKNACKSKRSSIRTETTKRKPPRKVKGKRRKKKKLSAKNIKFLKNLGLRVKKH